VPPAQSASHLAHAAASGNTTQPSPRPSFSETPETNLVVFRRHR
jgi:hypothetical protein